jgi:SNF family Na+-dependent transporter
VYLCVFKGVRSSSYVVWVTVPLPVVLIFILLIRSATLDGASRGIDIYMTGEDGTNLWDELQKSDLWSDAIGQIFF